MSGKLHVGLFTGSSITTFGGGERYIIELSNELKMKGIDVTIFTQGHGRKENMNIEQIRKMTEADIKPFRCIYTKATPTIPFFKYRDFSKLDCIYNMDESIFTNGFLQFYAKIKHIKYIYGMHIPKSFLFGNESAENNLKRKLWKLYRIPLIAFFKAFVVVIHVINIEQQNAIRSIGYDNRIFHIPDFVTLNRQKIGSNSSEFIVLFTGALNIEIKGIDLLADIISMVLNKNQKVKFVITGSPGNGTEFIWNLTKRYEKNVSYLGFISEEDLDLLHKKASLFVFTSRIDSFSLGIVGAQCYGLPCVAFDIAGPNDILTERFQGSVIPDFDTEKFCQKILHYYDEWSAHPEEYGELKEEIRDNIYNRLGKEVIIPKIIDMFSQ